MFHKNNFDKNKEQRVKIIQPALKKIPFTD